VVKKNNSVFQVICAYIHTTTVQVLGNLEYVVFNYYYCYSELVIRRFQSKFFDILDTFPAILWPLRSLYSNRLSIPES